MLRQRFTLLEGNRPRRVVLKLLCTYIWEFIDLNFVKSTTKFPQDSRKHNHDCPNKPFQKRLISSFCSLRIQETIDIISSFPFA
jgi:hypothetical protein